MNITIIGTGYVGLVTGTCLADVGNNVLCLDLEKKKIESLKKGLIPIFEPGLESLVKKNIEAGKLNFTSDIKESVTYGDVQFIAVGTPGEEDGSADLQYVLEAAKNIGKFMNSDKFVVNKSTVPVGTAEKVKQVISSELSKRRVNYELDVVSNPEFLKEGAAVNDFQKPDRIIIGVESEKAGKKMKQIYSPFQRNREKIILMDIRSAELTKYAANAMLATRISFMNELANLAEKLEADIENVRIGIGSDSRIGYSFLYPGCGYGGSCFPKDIRALVEVGDNLKQPLSILSAVEKANNFQKEVIIKKIKKIFGNNIKNMIFGVWGLAFKPGTDDMREAPSINIINFLIKEGAKINVFDPVAQNEARKIFSNNINYCNTPTKTIENCDALIILTEWKEFRSPDFKRMKKMIKTSTIFDGRNLYDPEQVRSEGLIYYAIGR